jgi:hypothetical protein
MLKLNRNVDSYLLDLRKESWVEPARRREFAQERRRRA